MDGIGAFTTNKGAVGRAYLRSGSYMGLSLCKPQCYETKNYIFLFCIQLLLFLRAVVSIRPALFCVKAKFKDQEPALKN